MPWSGAIKFNANIKGHLIAEAKGYFSWQVLWIFEDQFGHFKIGQWTLAEAGLNVTGEMGPGKPMSWDIKPYVGEMLQPGISKELRARTKPEREKAEKLARAGASGNPLARKLMRAPDDPPPAGGGAADEEPPPGGGAAAPAPAGEAAPPAAAEPAPVPEAAPAGPEATPEGGGAAPGAPAPAGAGANANLAAIAGIQPAGPEAAEGGGGGMIVLEGEPKIEE